jgi:hypothetical protein
MNHVVSSKQLREDHDKLLAKHNELLLKHDEVVVLNKSLDSCNKKLKLDYANLNMKYQKLEFAFDAIDDELEIAKTKSIKVNASTSFEDLVESPLSTICHVVSPSSSKTNHDREKEPEEELESMTKCVYTVTGRIPAQGDPLPQCKAFWDQWTWNLPQASRKLSQVSGAQGMLHQGSGLLLPTLLSHWAPHKGVSNSYSPSSYLAS